MNTYIRERVRQDCIHLMNHASNEVNIQHPVMRGRFRELLMNNLLNSWLPPYAKCGTGMVVDGFDRSRNSTQDDLIIFDKSLVPNVLVSPSSEEGIFPFDGVLVRIEVKSKLTKTNLKESVLAAAEINQMKFYGTEGRTWPLPINIIFAYDTDLTKGEFQEIDRLMRVFEELDVKNSVPGIPGPISALCIGTRGFWFFGKSDHHKESQMFRATLRNQYDHLIAFVGVISNSCFTSHILRQGRDPQAAVEGGIGRYILDYSCYEPI